MSVKNSLRHSASSAIQRAKEHVRCTGTRLRDIAKQIWEDRKSRLQAVVGIVMVIAVTVVAVIAVSLRSGVEQVAEEAYEQTFDFGTNDDWSQWHMATQTTSEPAKPKQTVAHSVTTGIPSQTTQAEASFDADAFQLGDDMIDKAPVTKPVSRRRAPRLLPVRYVSADFRPTVESVRSRRARIPPESRPTSWHARRWSGVPEIGVDGKRVPDHVHMAASGIWPSRRSEAAREQRNFLGGLLRQAKAMDTPVIHHNMHGAPRHHLEHLNTFLERGSVRLAASEASASRERAVHLHKLSRAFVPAI